MDSIQKIVDFDVYSIICSYTNIPLLLYKNEICITPYVIYNNYKLAIYLDSINSSDIERKYDYDDKGLNDYLNRNMGGDERMNNRIIKYLKEYSSKNKNKDLDKYITWNLYKTVICLFDEYLLDDYDISYYKEYIIIIKGVPEDMPKYNIYGYNSMNDNTVQTDIYNIKKRYILRIRPLYNECREKREIIPITPSDIINYFKSNPLEMKDHNISVKYHRNLDNDDDNVRYKYSVEIKDCDISIKYICNTHKYMVLDHTCEDLDNCQIGGCDQIHHYCYGQRLMLINYKTYEKDKLNYSNDCGV